MDRRAVPPRFPTPPAEYSQRYMNDLTRALETLVTQLRNPGEGRNTRLTLTDPPATADAIERGALYQENGIVRIKGYTEDGGGLTLLAPNGTEYLVTVDNTGNLVVT